MLVVNNLSPPLCKKCFPRLITFVEFSFKAKFKLVHFVGFFSYYLQAIGLFYAAF